MLSCGIWTFLVLFSIRPGYGASFKAFTRVRLPFGLSLQNQLRLLIIREELPTSFREFLRTAEGLARPHEALNTKAFAPAFLTNVGWHGPLSPGHRPDETEKCLSGPYTDSASRTLAIPCGGSPVPPF